MQTGKYRLKRVAYPTKYITLIDNKILGDSKISGAMDEVRSILETNFRNLLETSH